jgi:hypothetical protein
MIILRGRRQGLGDMYYWIGCVSIRQLVVGIWLDWHCVGVGSGSCLLEGAVLHTCKWDEARIWSCRWAGRQCDDTLILEKHSLARTVAVVSG